MPTTNYLLSLIARLYFSPLLITMKLHLQPKVIGAFISMATKTWNHIQSKIKDPMINTFSPNKLFL